MSKELDASFYKARATFLNTLVEASEEKYAEEVQPELEKLKAIPAGSKVYLWFEYDLFCQINLWSCCGWLQSYNKDLSFYWVTPGHEDWLGFGSLDRDALRLLMSTASSRISKGRLEEFAACLAAYLHHDHSELESYIQHGQVSSRSKVVLEAHLKRLSKGIGLSELEDAIVKMIEEEGSVFEKVFKRFWKEYGVYGMGDLQFKLLFDRIIRDLGKEP